MIVVERGDYLRGSAGSCSSLGDHGCILLLPLHVRQTKQSSGFSIKGKAGCLAHPLYPIIILGDEVSSRSGNLPR